MANFKTVEEAREYFKGDRFASLAGAVLDELTDEYSVCSLILNDDHKNAHGGIMGGVMFTLADFAFAALSNNIHKPTVAQQISVNYLNVPKGNKLTARAQCKKNGARTITANIDVTDDTGRDIALLVVNGFKL